MPKSIAIVGGGISGLVTAYDLERLTDCEIDLYEAIDRLGGKIQTSCIGEFLVEEGPDCYFSRKPGVNEFVSEIGLDEDVIRPIQKEFMMLIGGNLHRVPGGLVTLTYSKPDAIDEATFLSPEAKSRVMKEAEQPMGTGADESIRSFFNRRFGREFTSLVVEPLLAGTHGGDPDCLSMAALYPGYFNLERQHGSLSAGMPTPAAGSETSKPSFLSFRGGMQTLVDRVAKKLERTRVHLGTATDFEQLSNDFVVLAIPAANASNLIGKRMPEAGRALQRIPHRSSAIVTLAYDRDQIGHALDGTGFLVPPDEPCRVSGATWSSQKWEGRAPEGSVLMRVFMKSGLDADDDTLAMSGLAEIASLLDIKGEPKLKMVTRWTNALPQYEVGHFDRISAIEVELAATPNIILTGTSFRGVGIPDCISQGRKAAKTIAERL